MITLALALTGCASTAAPPSHLTRLWLDGQPLLGLSTEDGIVMLCHPGVEVGDVLDVQFPVGGSFVVDKALVDRCNDDLAVAYPLTASLLRGRIATELPRLDELMFVALRDEDDDPVMVAAQRWRGGALGDFLEVEDYDSDVLAAEYAGAGVYVHRDRRWEIVGMLAGITARDGTGSDSGLAYIGLLEMSRILPDRIDYFEHPVNPLRPDFEFGVPLQPGDIDYDAILEQQGAADGTPDDARDDRR